MIRHRKVTKRAIEAGKHRCECEAQFRSRFQLGRHVQKWNSRSDLREKALVR